MLRLKNILEVISEYQFNNLKTLSAYLDTLPSDYKYFDMRVYACDYGGHVATNSGMVDMSAIPGKKVDNCGTVSCLAGHGITAGIPAHFTEHWPDYVLRVFGASQHRTDATTDDAYLYDWLFSGSWGSQTSKPYAGAQRNQALEFARAKQRLRYTIDNQAFPVSDKEMTERDFRQEALKLTGAYRMTKN